MDNILPLVQFTIDPNDPKSGIKFVSFVENPAMESSMVFFNEEKQKPRYVKLSEYEQIILGAMLIPDKPILRFDSNKKPYYGYFTKETIKVLRNKFHEENQTSNVNFQHDKNQQIDSFLIESYIINDENQLASVKANGIQDATIGTWMASYKVKKSEDFEKIVKGEATGISIEAFLEVFTKANYKPVNKIEEKMNKFIEKFQALLEEVKAAEVVPSGNTASASGETAPVVEAKQLEVAKIYDGVDSVEWGEIGQPVNIILPDGTKKPAEKGAYITDTQKELIVDEAGNLMEIRSIEKEIESEGDAELKKKEEAYQTQIAQFSAEKLTLSKENETLKAELVELKKQVEELKKAPLTDPVVNPKDEVKKFSKEEFAKLSIAEKIAIKNGITLPEKFSKK